MTPRNFRDLVEERWAASRFVCVGLDTELKKIPAVALKASPEETVASFNRAMIDATHDLVCAYKPNMAFYEALGHAGFLALKETIAHVRHAAPRVPVILDAKRADIGNTNLGYVSAAFDALGADAVTVHPYLGAEALKPFLDRKDRGVIVLCRTSNPGAGELQDAAVRLDGGLLRAFEARAGRRVADGHVPLYQLVAFRVAAEWNGAGNCAVVVGATYPDELQEVRSIVGDMPILIPGIGAQGGDVEKTVKAGMDSRGLGMIINSSRGILYASDGPDFAEAARRETSLLHDRINASR